MSAFTRPQRIQSLHPRLGASFALIPLTIGIESFLLFSTTFPSSGFFGVSAFGFIALCAFVPVVVFFGGSLLIWCPVVNWTARKVTGTIFVSVSLAFSVIGAAYCCTLLGIGEAIYGTLAASLILGAVALFLVNWIWWTPPHERPTELAVPCPKCGYDLRAQKYCRCPECGLEFTLGQLVGVRAESRAAVHDGG